MTSHTAATMRSCRALLLATALACLAACGGGEPPELPDPPSIVEGVPSAPTPADAGQPGEWEALALPAPARAFVVAPAAQGPASGVLLVHGTWGVNEDVRTLARELAGAGFLVCAPDLYEGVVATSRTSAPELQAAVAPARAAALIAAGLERLRRDPRTSGRPLALLALGVGSAWVMQTDLAAAPQVAGLVFDNSPLFLYDELPVGGRIPVLLLAGDLSSHFSEERRAALDRRFGEAGGRLSWGRVPEAGTDILDPRALGFSRRGYEVGLDAVTGFLRSLG